MTVFQAGERVIVTDGQFIGHHGEIIGMQDKDGVALVEVELDSGSTELFRAALLIKERIRLLEAGDAK